MTLSPEWETWRSEREAHFLAQGAPPGPVAAFVLAEARGRARIAGFVGFAAAAQAELFWERGPDGETTMRLAVDPALAVGPGPLIAEVRF